MKKVCIKGDGTAETGKRIIEYFVSFGGINRCGYSGTTINYYYINDNNRLIVSLEIPIGYELITIPEPAPENTFPREMLVWDNEEVRAIKGIVDGMYKDRYVVKTNCDLVIYKHAKEIESPKPLTTNEKIADLQKQIDELKQSMK